MCIVSQYSMEVLCTQRLIDMYLALQSAFQGMLSPSADASSSQKVRADMKFTDV
jgi:hypothetical protein